MSNCSTANTCPLCRCTSSSLGRAPDTGTPYQHCPHCDLIFAEKSAIPSPQQERARYLEHDNTLDNDGYVNMLQGFLQEAVLPHLKGQGGRALDFGCGPGPVLGFLMEREDFTVDLYDPYFFPDDAYVQCEYDVITATEVLEHLRDPRGVLQELVPLLAPGGILAIMTHLHPGAEEFLPWWYHRDPTHIVFYSERTFQWLQQHLGVRLIYSDGEKTLTFRRVT